MATQATRNFRLAQGDGTVFYDPGIMEASAQTFVAGDLVTITPGTGTIKVCVGSEGTQTNTIGGIALEAATTSTSHAVHIQEIHSDDLYIGNIYSGGSGAATAITQLGKIYEIRKISAGVWAIDSNAGTTNLRVKVVGFVYGPDFDSSGNPYNKAIGDTAGEVYFKFISDDGTDIDILDFDH